MDQENEVEECGELDQQLKKKLTAHWEILGSIPGTNLVDKKHI